MEQYKIKVKPVNAIIGVDIEVDGKETMAIAFRDHEGETHTLVVEGSLGVYDELKNKLEREIAAVRNFHSR